MSFIVHDISQQSTEYRTTPHHTTPSSYFKPSDTYHIQVGQWYDTLQFLALFSIHHSFQYKINAWRDILLKQFVQFRLFVLIRPCFTPLGPVWHIAQILRVNIYHTTTGHCCWRGIAEVGNLKQVYTNIRYICDIQGKLDFCHILAPYFDKNDSFLLVKQG